MTIICPCFGCTLILFPHEIVDNSVLYTFGYIDVKIGSHSFLSLYFPSLCTSHKDYKEEIIRVYKKMRPSFGFRLWNDLYCVEWGVKLYSLTHPSFGSGRSSRLSGCLKTYSKGKIQGLFGHFEKMESISSITSFYYNLILTSDSRHF